MEFEGTFDVNVSRDKTWEFIMNPAETSICLPDS